MFKKKGELLIPPIAKLDPKAVEIGRIWASGGKQHVSLRIGIWEDPASWGLMLVDLARHVARAYEQDEGCEPDQVLARIKEGFDAEWTYPTDEPEGQIIN